MSFGSSLLLVSSFLNATTNGNFGSPLINQKKNTDYEEMKMTFCNNAVEKLVELKASIF